MFQFIMDFYLMPRVSSQQSAVVVVLVLILVLVLLIVLVLVSSPQS